MAYNGKTMGDPATTTERSLDPTVVQSVLQELCEQLLTQMSATVQRIVLFGSHARGTASQESDFDVLVVVDDGGQATLDQARLARYEVMRRRDFQPLISMLLLSVQEWQDLSKHSAGLKKNIEEEGLTLWPTT